MIYLIDDNKYGQMSENYKYDFTHIMDDYGNYITWKSTVNENEVGTIFSDASCILIHDSISDTEMKNRIVALAKYNGIPYVIFSNSYTATAFDGCSIIKIKKDRMYYNLIDFMEKVKQDGSIDLQILSLGNNYSKSKARIIQNRLLYKSLLSNNSFDYETTFSYNSEPYKDLKELVHLTNPSEDIELKFANFEDNLLNQDIDIESMKKTVKELVTKIINNG